MTGSPHLRSWRDALARLAWHMAWNDDRAAQIVEFAVALPLLVVFVVGIFDFSSAYTLKQKLTNIARDTARVTAADPANDVFQPSHPLPASIVDAFQVVDNYLLSNKINDCGINVSSFSQTPPAKWTFSGTSGCVGNGLIITINRGYYFPIAGGGTPASLNCVPPEQPGLQTAVMATCVSIQYAYQWRFGRAASLLGSTVALPTQITAIAVVMNEN